MMKDSRLLRRFRIVVSVLTALSFTLLWVGYGDVWAMLFGWANRMQFVCVGAVTVPVVTLALWLVLTSMFGRVYCSGVCPMGTWFDAIARMGRMQRRRAGMSCRYSYSPALVRWRYISLSAVCLCLLVGLVALPLLLEPANMYAAFLKNVVHPLWGTANNAIAGAGEAVGGWHVTYVSVTVAGMFAVALSFLTIVAVSIPAWLYGRSYCNSLCPVGTMLGFVSRQALWRIDIDTDLCVNCGRCEDVCKASCIDLRDHVVDGSRCVNCFNCLTVCPNDAIRYRRWRKQLSIPMLQSARPAKNGVATSATMSATTQNVNKFQKNETISRTSQPCADRGR